MREAIMSCLLLALCSTVATAQRAIVRVKNATAVTSADGTAHPVAAGTLLEQRSRDTNGATVVVNASLEGRLPASAIVTTVAFLDKDGKPVIPGFSTLPPITPPGTDPPVNPWRHALEEYAVNNPAAAMTLTPLLQKYQLDIDVKEVQKRLQLQKQLQQLQLQQLQLKQRLEVP